MFLGSVGSKQLCCAAALFLACASGSGVPQDQVTRGPAPDWVVTGGKSPRFPTKRFLTGFAMVEAPPGQVAIERAKQQATADLSRKISVRIQASLRDVSEEKDGVYSYEVASIVNSTSDIVLSGLDHELYAKSGRSWALAYLDRATALRQRRALRRQALVEVQECFDSGERHERAGREADAIATFESCRRPIAVGLEHDAVARVFAAVGPEDAHAHRELAAATRKVDEKVRAILRSPATSTSEAIERLGIQLRQQHAMSGSDVTVTAFTYGTTDLSSVFGRQCGIELENVLARAAGTRGASRGSRVVRGIYFERGDEIRISATVRDTETGRLVASAESTLPRSVVHESVSLKPANFEAALRDQKILAEGELVSSGLAVEVWTNRGRRGVVYARTDEMTLYYRVNQPAWVRLIYVLQSGEQVPIIEAMYVDEAHVNQVITYPDTFEIVPPYGVEHIHATAFTSRPNPIVTQTRRIAGELYQVVADGMNSIVAARGIKRRQSEQLAESFVTVTTTPK